TNEKHHGGGRGVVERPAEREENCRRHQTQVKGRKKRASIARDAGRLHPVIITSRGPRGRPGCCCASCHAAAHFSPWVGNLRLRRTQQGARHQCHTAGRRLSYNASSSGAPNGCRAPRKKRPPPLR